MRTPLKRIWEGIKEIEEGNGMQGRSMEEECMERKVMTEGRKYTLGKK
jgi:hypothetical protein